MCSSKYPAMQVVGDKRRNAWEESFEPKRASLATCMFLHARCVTMLCTPSLCHAVCPRHHMLSSHVCSVTGFIIDACFALDNIDFYQVTSFPCVHSNLDEPNAFFYTLVSQDTQEMYFSHKRQQFLIDQGYAFKVIPNLLDGADTRSLKMSTRDEQVNMLARILSLGEAEMGETDVVDDDDGPVGRRGVTKRRVGDMSKLSGAAGMTYVEYATGNRGGAKPKKKKGAHVGESVLKKLKKTI